MAVASAGSVFRLLLVASLVFSLISFLNAVPVTRIISVHGSQLSEALQVDGTKLVVNERMVIELNDYPGSGANNRHTPKPPQLARGCIDC